jgi:magnesium-transporting ATPase (P-type)
VTGGTAEAVVTATGMQTRFGRIASLSQRTERDRSPLEHEIDRVVYIVAALAVTIGTAFFVVSGLTDSMDVQDRFVFAIGVTVALVPNGLLPTVTLALAMASQRMAKRNALVRRLSSVETLGETTIICTDKTGTLTENQMTVQRVWTPEREYTVEGAGYEPFGRFRAAGVVADPAPLTELLRAGLLCNDARLVQGADGWSVIGDPTEGALVVLAEKGGLHHRAEAARAPRLREIPLQLRAQAHDHRAPRRRRARRVRQGRRRADPAAHDAVRAGPGGGGGGRGGDGARRAPRPGLCPPRCCPAAPVTTRTRSSATSSSSASWA